MFRASEAVSNGMEVTKGRAVSWLVQEFAYYLSRAIKNRGKEGFSYKSYVTLLRRRQDQSHCPSCEVIETPRSYATGEVADDHISDT